MFSQEVVKVGVAKYFDRLIEVERVEARKDGQKNADERLGNL
jgi:hypothetical protein